MGLGAGVNPTSQAPLRFLGWRGTGTALPAHRLKLFRSHPRRADLRVVTRGCCPGFRLLLAFSLPGAFLHARS